MLRGDIDPLFVRKRLTLYQQPLWLTAMWVTSGRRTILSAERYRFIDNSVQRITASLSTQTFEMGISQESTDEIDWFVPLFSDGILIVLWKSMYCWLHMGMPPRVI